MPDNESYRGRLSIYDIGLAGLTAAFAAPLLAYMVTGLNMRYSGDDYCYAGMLRQNGLVQTLLDTYSGPSPFHGNRVALTITSGLADTIGPLFSAVLPGLALAIWLIGLVVLIREIAMLAGLRVKRMEPILLGEATILVTLLITPQLVQSLYWRSGMLPYLAPTILYPFIATMMTRQMRSYEPSPPLLAGIFMLSLFTGMYSETAAAVQMSMVILTAIAAAIASRAPARWSRSMWYGIGAFALGTSVAIGILALSPSNETRLAALDQTENLIELGQLSANHAYLYIRSLLPRHLVPLLILFMVAFWLASQILRRTGILPVKGWRDALIGLGIIAVTSISIILACMLPSAYAQSSYPVGRALIIASFCVAIATAAIGIVFSSLLEAKAGQHAKAVPWIAGVAVALAGIYALLGTLRTLDELPRYTKWARFWDDRNTEILELRRAGAGDVEVVLLDHIIPDVAELGQDPDFFYNNCAEWYYDVQSIAANQPGWDE